MKKKIDIDFKTMLRAAGCGGLGHKGNFQTHPVLHIGWLKDWNVSTQVAENVSCLFLTKYSSTIVSVQ